MFGNSGVDVQLWKFVSGVVLLHVGMMAGVSYAPAPSTVPSPSPSSLKLSTETRFPTVSRVPKGIAALCALRSLRFRSLWWQQLGAGRSGQGRGRFAG